MWLLRRLIGEADPRARGINRLYVVPLSTVTLVMLKWSTFLPACDALAAADLITLANGPDARLSTNCREARASFTFLPRTKSAIKRTFRGDWR